MNNNARVGIFMPAYNQGNYIDETIDSLKKQTFQDFIVHIVDDGSNDGLTPGKLKSIKYSQSILFPNKENKGVSARAREHYKLLKNDYIMVLCADDKIAPTFLEKTVDFLENNPEYGACGTGVQHFGESDTRVSIKDELTKLPGILVANGFLGSSLMRKKALNSINLGDDFVRFQDWERWIAMLQGGGD